MSKEITDERVDALLKDLFATAAIDDPETNEIADSPAIWWGVQRRIAEAKSPAATPWPPISKFWQILKFGVPAFATFALLVGFLVFRSQPVTTEKAELINTPVETLEIPNLSTSEPAVPVVAREEPKSNGSNAVTRKDVRRIATARKPVAKAVPAVHKTEIKTEFIALSYARDAESGQVVRVRVPSSMMVTLGLVSTVEKPSNLVDAEIIVGDDGLTRAIRFIR